MVMRFLVCLLPLLVAAAPIAETPPDATAGKCPNAKLSQAKRDKPVTAHPLDREPGAKQEIAVQRTDAKGCVKPIVVRDDVGGDSR
jgi:hypothetical protein